MNNPEWSQLPELVRNAEAMRLLGVSRDGLNCLAKNCIGLVVILPGMKHRRFRKTVLARLAGVGYDNGQVGEQKA